MNIVHQKEQTRFSLQDDVGKEWGELTYRLAPGMIQILFVGVNPARRGEKLGDLLVEAAVAYAKESSYRIKPICPFAAYYLKKKAEYQDLLID